MRQTSDAWLMMRNWEKGNLISVWDKLNEVFVAAGGYVIACVNHGSVVVNLEDVNW
jgi:hypothetical protein